MAANETGDKINLLKDMSYIDYDNSNFENMSLAEQLEGSDFGWIHKRKNIFNETLMESIENANNKE